MNNIENTVRDQILFIAKDRSVSSGDLDMSKDLNEAFGITSLKMIMLMTNLCKELGVTLSSFDERDLVSIRSANDLVSAFQKNAGVN